MGPLPWPTETGVVSRHILFQKIFANRWSNSLKLSIGGAIILSLSCLLHECEGISLSPSSVARILKAAGILSPKKHRPPKLHRSRPRKPQMGLLVQIDGSYHDWLEGRGPKLVLLLAVDDATGQILAALFGPSEDFEGYRRLLYDLVINYGIPVAIYSDRHTLFFPPKGEKSTASIEHPLLGQQRSLTQIGRILNELGIQHIPVRSPQAKGRIECLWGTLQSRLVIEMSIAGISSPEEANAFLSGFIARFNARFAVELISCYKILGVLLNQCLILRDDNLCHWQSYGLSQGCIPNNEQNFSSELCPFDIAIADSDKR